MTSPVPSYACQIENEDGRLDALYRYEILDSAPEESFDRIIRLAKVSLQVPIAYVAFIDRDRQWFKSREGISSQETPRKSSFCTYTIQGVTPLMVPDTTLDERFRDSSLVTESPFIRFYMGVPLRTPDGFNIGTLCVADTKPRDASPEQVAVLADLARLVVDELELRRLAATDSLTGLLTPRSFTAEATRNLERARRDQQTLSVIMLDIDHFKAVNDRHGHAAGDHVIRAVASAASDELRASDLLGRLGGEEFAFVLPECDIVQAAALAERLRLAVARRSIESHPGIGFTASFGVTELADADSCLSDLLARADAALYRAKECGRNRVVINVSDQMKEISAAA